MHTAPSQRCRAAATPAVPGGRTMSAMRVWSRAAMSPASMPAWGAGARQPAREAPAPIASAAPMKRRRPGSGGRAGIAVEAPVPGFVDDAVRVVARIAHAEAEGRGMGLQPGEGGGGLERFLGRRFARRADVQRTAVVVLAVAGSRVDREDPVQRLPARQLPL